MAGFNESTFSNLLGPQSGIIELMDDLGRAMASGDILMMGGGNPAIIPEVVEVFRKRMQSILDSTEFDQMISVYEPPQGNASTIEALASLLREHFAWFYLIACAATAPSASPNYCDKRCIPCWMPAPALPAHW